MSGEKSGRAISQSGIDGDRVLQTIVEMTDGNRLAVFLLLILLLMLAPIYELYRRILASLSRWSL